MVIFAFIALIIFCFVAYKLYKTGKSFASWFIGKIPAVLLCLITIEMFAVFYQYYNVAWHYIAIPFVLFSVFIIGALSIVKFPIIFKSALAIAFLALIYGYYKIIGGYYYPAMIGFCLFILLGVIEKGDFIKNIRRYMADDSISIKKVMRNTILFYALNLVFVCALCIQLYFYPLANNNFYAICFLLVCSIVLYYKHLTDLNVLYNDIDEIISTLDKIEFFTIESLYERFDIKGRRLKFKDFIDEVVQGYESKGEIQAFNASGVDFYFEPSFLLVLLKKMESISKQSPKVSFKDALIKAEAILPLLPMYLEDFLKAGGIVNKYVFDDGYYFIHNENLDDFAICSSCGKAEDKNTSNDIEGEWFCSSLCENTENLCLEISEELHPAILENESYDEYKGRLSKNLSNASSVAATTLGVSEIWAENYKALSNLDTGHGFMAENANHRADIWAGRKAKLVGGDNATNGADRIVDGMEIQTKYCKTAVRSVNAGFDNKGDGSYKYFGEDGKPMQLEVPKDQYDKAVQLMEQKIKDGKVNGVSDPNEAKNLIRKGNYTYEEVKNMTKFCTKDSLKYDARNGAITAVIAFGITFVINASLCYYRERDIKKALKESLVIGVKTGGKAFAIYMIGAQAQKIPAVNNFLNQVINFDFAKNAAGKALGKAFVKQSGVSVNTAANSALRGTIVTAAATMAVTSSIEIVQVVRGQISGMQCVKNISVNAGGIAGGAAGALAGAAALSFIPGVGTLVGGLAGGLIGGMGGSAAIKKLMDNFIEDDLAKKQRIFFEHIITLSILFKLSKEESRRFSAIVNDIVQEDKDFFGKKFLVKSMLPYANSILKPVVVAIVSNRISLPPSAFEKEEIIDVVAEVIEEAS